MILKNRVKMWLIHRFATPCAQNATTGDLAVWPDVRHFSAGLEPENIVRQLGIGLDIAVLRQPVVPGLLRKKLLHADEFSALP